jgi:hypothetical protein
VNQTDPLGLEGIDDLMVEVSALNVLAQLKLPSVNKTVVEPISLSKAEPALMLERVFVAETKGVEEKGFDKDEAVKGIRAIGAIIYNRSHAKQLGFTVKYPTNLLGVVKEKGQFAGFEDYDPKDDKGGLSSGLLRRIDTVVQGANYPKDKKHYPSYLAVLKEAKVTAQNVINEKIADPYSPSYTFAIRTSGSTGPGGSFQKIGTLAGNDFYGLSAPPPKKK